MLLSDNFKYFLIESNLLFWVLLFGLLIMVECGWRLGVYFASVHGLKKADSTDTFLASIFGLLALLVAITFSGASDRLDQKRQLILKEIGTISSAYQSIDLLPGVDQPKIRQLFRDYLENRINIYHFHGNPMGSEFIEMLANHDRIGGEIWSEAVRVVGNTPFPQKLVAAQILPEVSDMSTASDDQRLAMKFHPPDIVFQALVILCMAGSLISGYNLGMQSQRDWLLTIFFVVLMSGTIFIILSLEFPILGKLQLDDYGAELSALRRAL